MIKGRFTWHNIIEQCVFIYVGRSSLNMYWLRNPMVILGVHMNARKLLGNGTRVPSPNMEAKSHPMNGEN